MGIFLTYFIATPSYRGWQSSDGLLLLHSFLSFDIFVAFSILRFGTSAKSVSWVGLTQFNKLGAPAVRLACVGRAPASSIFCPALHHYVYSRISGSFLDDSVRDHREHF